MKTYFKTLPNYESCVISNGKSYIFNRVGECIKEDAGLIPAYTNHTLKVNIISVISTNGITELALDFANETFRKFSISLEGLIVVQQLLSRKGFSHILSRNGVARDRDTSLRYTQAFFIYPYDYDILSCLQGLDLREVL
jgi:hypothetical protein